MQANDAHALEAVIEASDIVNAILVGDEQEIRKELVALKQNPDNFEIVQVPRACTLCLRGAAYMRAELTF